MTHRHYQELTWSNNDYRALQKQLEKMEKLKLKWQDRAKKAEAEIADNEG